MVLTRSRPTHQLVVVDVVVVDVVVVDVVDVVVVDVVVVVIVIVVVVVIVIVIVVVVGALVVVVERVHVDQLELVGVTAAIEPTKRATHGLTQNAKHTSEAQDQEGSKEVKQGVKECTRQ